MCLAIPGKILSLGEDPLRTAKVSFGGIVKDVSLIYVPEAQVGNYVITHVGFAISRLEEEEARKTLQYWDQIEANPPSPPFFKGGAGGID